MLSLHKFDIYYMLHLIAHKETAISGPVSLSRLQLECVITQEIRTIRSCYSSFV